MRTIMHKAVKAQSKAGIDIWESRYFYPGAARRTKQGGKRTHKRAQRRLDKALIAEQRAA
jgi:hypothetical protein